MTGTAVMSVGSNLGDRLTHLAAGLEILASFAPVLAVSGVHETGPVGRVDQPRFLNIAALLGTADPELALLAAHAAEDARGRLRPVRWGPRTLDVDVVAVGQQRSADPRLTLPHPCASERGFVLAPWLELDPVAELPGHGPVRALLRSLDAPDVRRVGELPAWWRR